jgi:hypothetical protein
MAGSHALRSVPTGTHRGANFKRSFASAIGSAGAAPRRPVSVAVNHIVEYGYFFAAAGCADAAGFVHSTFVGLLVMAGTFLAIEWRASKGA